MQVHTYMESDLTVSLNIYRGSRPDGNQTIKNDFDDVQHLVKNKKIYTLIAAVEAAQF